MLQQARPWRVPMMGAISVELFTHGYSLRTMPDDSVSQRKEWLSRAFLIAVTATAGYSTEFVLNDRYGTDAVVREGGVTVDFQLKATASPVLTADALNFDLDVPTYNKLRDPIRSAPGYLLVVIVPTSPDDWLSHSDHELVLRHCGYWKDLTGAPETANLAKVRVRMPLENILNVSNMYSIMESARERLS